MGVYRDWCVSLCKKCGLPLADHDNTTVNQWYGGFYTCIGVDALRRDQKKREVAETKQLGKERHAELEEGRSWYIGRFPDPPN